MQQQKLQCPKEWLIKLKQLVPELNSTRHKGQNGKFGIIGGSEEYTGAPYYAAISQLKGGGDLSHIICTKNAAIPIKSYSPEIIVHPYLISCSDCTQEQSKVEISKTLQKLLNLSQSINGFVIGPGLGRDIYAQEYIVGFLEQANQNLIITIDADGIYYLTQSSSSQLMLEILQKKAENIILTPNQAEIERLYNYFLPSYQLYLPRSERLNFYQKLYDESKNETMIMEVSIEDELVKDDVMLANTLGNCNIIHKGLIDIITNGKKAYLIQIQGSFKRCGGIGDILSGLTCLYSFWAKEFATKIEQDDKILTGCILSSYITKRASHRAFEKHKYALTAPNIIEEIGNVFNEFYFSKL